MDVHLRCFHDSKVARLPLAPYKQLANASFSSPDRPAGWFAALGGRSIGLFAARRLLFIYCDGIADLATAVGSAASHRKGPQECELHFKFHGTLVALRYRPELEPASTLYCSEEEEDVDFGLWINNIVNSSERKRIFIDSHSGPSV